MIYKGFELLANASADVVDPLRSLPIAYVGVVLIVIANFAPLEAIASMGGAGFLLLFMAVNIANVRLARDTGRRAWISRLAALSPAVALIVLCMEVDENPMTRNHLGFSRA